MFKQITKFRYTPQIICLGLLVASFAIISTPSTKLCAATTQSKFESPVCDPNIWDTIVGRAWIEAQREIEISQSLITRPDSVLELSCFDAFAYAAAKDATPFSGATAQDKDTVKVLIGNAVTGSMTKYLTAAGYSISSGGGTMADPGYKADAEGALEEQCKLSLKVWTHFKCSNAPDFNAFIFDTLKNNDPRKVYVSLGNTTGSNTCPEAGRPTPTALVDDKDVWTAQIDRLNSPAVAAATPSYFDLVTTFSDMTSPIGACAAPIPTGVQIITSSGSSTPEMICPNPGCSYNGSSCVR